MSTRSGRDSKLSIEEIGAASLRIVDEAGTSGLTMRVLGKALGCDPMAIYRYVKDRDSLLTLVAGVVFETVEAPDPQLVSNDWLLELADNYRAAFHEHPNVAIIVGHTQFTSTIGLDLIDAIIEHLSGDDLPGGVEDRMNAYIGAVIGYVTLELSPPSSHPHDVVFDHDAYPHLAEHRDDVVGSAFGLRSSEATIVPLEGGFRLLMSSLINALLTPRQNQ